MRVSELSGADLDFWVAKAEGVETQPCKYGNYGLSWKHSEWVSDTVPPRYSSDWAIGGPIIERDRIDVCASADGAWYAVYRANPDLLKDGPTPLIAAMRAKVASEYGEEVPDQAAKG